jgi:hypothetical protein
MILCIYLKRSGDDSHLVDVFLLASAVVHKLLTVVPSSGDLDNLSPRIYGKGWGRSLSERRTWGGKGDVLEIGDPFWDALEMLKSRPITS